ncbi:hypothetical protein OH76DRAFT_1490973 [Lentinus brumalis]|uniref:Uncharacterized protein n=1 Tax=Lentinus brumalis TaxID=2498619 RepID=A0A371CH50_9APHY|nr:hypothetical protein OH76DRAFT_1490973 [Polyporus brumalis]
MLVPGFKHMATIVGDLSSPSGLPNEEVLAAWERWTQIGRQPPSTLNPWNIHQPYLNDFFDTEIRQVVLDYQPVSTYDALLTQHKCACYEVFCHAYPDNWQNILNMYEEIQTIEKGFTTIGHRNKLFNRIHDLLISFARRYTTLYGFEAAILIASNLPASDQGLATLYTTQHAEQFFNSQLDQDDQITTESFQQFICSSYASASAQEHPVDSDTQADATNMHAREQDDTADEQAGVPDDPSQKAGVSRYQRLNVIKQRLRTMFEAAGGELPDKGINKRWPCALNAGDDKLRHRFIGPADLGHNLDSLMQPEPPELITVATGVLRTPSLSQLSQDRPPTPALTYTERQPEVNPPFSASILQHGASNGLWHRPSHPPPAVTAQTFDAHRPEDMAPSAHALQHGASNGLGRSRSQFPQNRSPANAAQTCDKGQPEAMAPSVNALQHRALNGLAGSPSQPPQAPPSAPAASMFEQCQHQAPARDPLANALQHIAPVGNSHSQILHPQVPAPAPAAPMFNYRQFQLPALYEKDVLAGDALRPCPQLLPLIQQQPQIPAHLANAALQPRAVVGAAVQRVLVFMLGTRLLSRGMLLLNSELYLRFL